MSKKKGGRPRHPRPVWPAPRKDEGYRARMRRHARNLEAIERVHAASELYVVQTGSVCTHHFDNEPWCLICGAEDPSFATAQTLPGART